MFVVADAIRLTLFPAMMAFAASSDLLTMTISNRVSLILLAGFFALAAIAGISAMDMLSHLGAGCVVLVAAFGLFARGIIGGGDEAILDGGRTRLVLQETLHEIGHCCLHGPQLAL